MATRLRPFFSFFGSKWYLAPKYPKPQYDTIIEPFAGSAGYSLLYPDRDIILIERDPIVASIWRWLISAKPDDILSLPRLEQGESLNDYDMPQEAKWLMGFWVNQTGAYPVSKATKFGAVYTTTRNGKPTTANRTEMYVNRVVSQLGAIRHWRVINSDYNTAPLREATWFIDPPYEQEGSKYRFGRDTIDYGSLANWCRMRPGQTIVCENEGATWLPFEPFTVQYGAMVNGKRRNSQEVVWLNDTSEIAEAA